MRWTTFALSTTFVTTTLLSACDQASTRTPAATTCTPVKLSGSYRALERVEITKLPHNFVPSQVKFDVGGRTVTVPALSTKTGVVFLAVPRADETRGEVTATLEGEGGSCAPIKLVVAPLLTDASQNVDGAARRAVAARQEELNNQARVAGVDPAALRGDLAVVAAVDPVLAARQFLLDHPSNPLSTGEILRTASVTVGGETIQVDTHKLDAFFAVLEAPGSNITQAARVQPLGAASCPIGTKARANVTNGQALADCLAAQRLSKELIGGDVEKLLDGASYTLLIATLVMALIPGPEELVLLPAAMSALSAEVLFHQALAALLPAHVRSESLRFDLTLDKLSRAEQTGQWQAVRLDAQSEGTFNLMLVVNEFTGAFLSKLLKFLPADASSIERKLSSWMTDFAQTLTGLMAQQLKLPATTLGPYDYPDVDITSFTAGYNVRVAPKPLIVVDKESQTFRIASPAQPGTTELWIDPKAGVFFDPITPQKRSVGVSLTYSGWVSMSTQFDTQECQPGQRESVTFSGPIEVAIDSDGLARWKWQKSEQFSNCFGFNFDIPITWENSWSASSSGWTTNIDHTDPAESFSGTLTGGPDLSSGNFDLKYDYAGHVFSMGSALNLRRVP